MLPVFKEYIQFLNDSGIDMGLKEGYWWIDNQIIKGFDSDGNIIKFARIHIDNDLKLSYTKYNNNINIITWSQLVNKNLDRLNELEFKSIRLLRAYGSNTDRTIINTNSTGKDSMVKTYLAKKSGLTFDTYFNVTTMDVADSNIMAKKQQYKFIRPKGKHKSFYNWSEEENIIPSRLNRVCCTYFKESPTIDNFDDNAKLLFLFGMRNDESNNRSTYGDVWINEKWGKKRDWIGILPIRQWTDLDIWLYIFREGIEINQKYKKGYDRVGCGIVCPNYTKSTWVLDKYWYPKMYERWRQRLEQDFKDNYKWIIMNCTLKEYVQEAWNGGVYRKEPTPEGIQEFADYKDITYEVAEKYFLRTCSNGCLNKRGNIATIKDKDTLAMNMKMFGRNIDKFMCKKCLIKYFGWTKEDWNNKVNEFKQSGCKLF